MVVVPISWSGRHWALPFLTVLAPSARCEKHRKRHKTLTDWARQAILQTKRWLPNRLLIFVADSGFAALELLAAVRHRVCVITRLRLDAALYKPAPPRRKGQRGRTPLKGRRLPTLRAVLASRKTVWATVVVSQWYNAQQRKLLVATGQRGLVPFRHRAGADPLGAGARSDRRARARSFPQHRPGCDAGDDPRLVRLTLAGGDHLPGGSYSPWSRDPAPVVRSRHPAYHPGAAGAVLADHCVGRWPGTRYRNGTAAECRRLVPQAGTDIQ